MDASLNYSGAPRRLAARRNESIQGVQGSYILHLPLISCEMAALTTCISASAHLKWVINPNAAHLRRCRGITTNDTSCWDTPGHRQCKTNIPPPLHSIKLR